METLIDDFPGLADHAARNVDIAAESRLAWNKKNPQQNKTADQNGFKRERPRQRPVSGGIPF